MRLFDNFKNNIGYYIIAVYFYMYTCGRVFGFENAYMIPFAVALIYALYLLMTRKTTLANYRNWIVWFLLFSALMGVSVLWSKSPTAVSHWTSIYMLMLKVMTVGVICSTDRGIYKLFYTFAIVGLFSFITLFYTGNLFAFRAEQIAFMDNENSFGLICDMFAIGAFYSFATSKSRIMKVLFIGAMLLDLYMMVLTGGRKFFIFLFVTIASFYFFKAKKINLGTIISLSLISVLVIYFLYHLMMSNDFLYTAIGYRFDGSVEGEDVQSYLMSLALNAFYEYPIFGLGVAGFQAYNPTHLYSHCNYTELLANFGVVGFVIYYSRHWKCLKILFKNRDERDEESAIYFSLIMAILIIDVFTISFNQTAFIPLLIFLISGYCKQKEYSI